MKKRVRKIDPNVALAELRHTLKTFQFINPEHHLVDRGLLVIGLEALEKFQVLDEWLKRGGFLPDEWSRPV